MNLFLFLEIEGSGDSELHSFLNLRPQLTSLNQFVIFGWKHAWRIDILMIACFIITNILLLLNSSCAEAIILQTFLLFVSFHLFETCVVHHITDLWPIICTLSSSNPQILAQDTLVQNVQTDNYFYLQYDGNFKT